MDEHPLIRFAEGPAGRRARLMGTGKDVWEVIATVRDNGGDAAEAARYLEIPLGLVQAAITYYGAYQDEIDQWIEANEQEAAEASAAWSAGTGSGQAVRLLLDEMLSPVIARELCARGHDVQAVAGHPEREALSDPEVLALARAERRAVVTNNVRDFRPLHVEAVLPGGPGHYGMIFMPGTTGAPRTTSAGSSQPSRSSSANTRRGRPRQRRGMAVERTSENTRAMPNPHQCALQAFGDVDALQRRTVHVVRAENPVHGSDQQSCASRRPAVMITDHVPAVRLPPDHADGRMAAAVAA